MPMEPALRTRSSRPVGTRVGTPGVPDPGGHGPVGAGVVNAGSRPYAGVAMSTTVSARRLLGRHSECAALDQLVASVRAGPSGALVLRGGAGVGKTALLDYLAQHSSGCGIARAAGVESEMELAYAGLQQLCAPFLDRVERLPRPAARCAWHRVRFARRRRAGPVPRRPGGPESALRRRGRPTPRLHRGRRAVARCGLGTGAGVRRAVSARSRSGWSSPCASRPASGISRAARARRGRAG